jgi:hypothetical protein
MVPVIHHYLLRYHTCTMCTHQILMKSFFSRNSKFVNFSVINVFRLSTFSIERHCHLPMVHRVPLCVEQHTLSDHICHYLC